MHPICYFRIDNIEVDQPAVSDREIMLRDLIPTVETARHAQLDAIEKRLYMRFGTKGKKLKFRRATLARYIECQIQNDRKSRLIHAKRDAFIGPLTIAMQNGHPF